MNIESGDQLHSKFKKRLVYMVLVMIGFFVVMNWNELFGFVDDWTTPEGVHWIFARMSACGILFLLMLIVLGSAFRITIKVKKSAQASSAFNDEFHSQNEKKAAFFAFIVTILALALLTALSALSFTLLSPYMPVLSGFHVGQIAMLVAVVSFVGSYLFYEREQ
jgi:uncharacterized membrane protein SpoIIM required for sporulation